MSTDIATVFERGGQYGIDVYIGTGGVAVFAFAAADRRGTKVWLDRAGVEALREALAEALARVGGGSQ